MYGAVQAAAKHPNKRNFLGELNRRIYVYNTLNITAGDDNEDGGGDDGGNDEE